MTFVQPFAIDFRHETEHVIAFCSGHPEFEAIEAFVAAQRVGTPLIRAILTRHDMRQIDHINEEAVVRERRAIDPTRPTYFAPIAYEQTTVDGRPRRLLRFPSFQGEPIEVDLVTAMPAHPAYGGLTDPMGHAPDVLPLMWRSASALVAPCTGVTIGGVRYEVPDFVQAGERVGPKAFYTKGFAVGIFRTPVTDLELVAAPARMAVGDRWTYRQAGRRVDYVIATREGEQLVIRRSPGDTETVHAEVRGDGLYVRRITIASGSETASTLTLDVAPYLPDPTTPPPGDERIGTFTIGIDDHADLVTGTIERAKAGLMLLPAEPAWARSRAIHLQPTRDGDTARLRASIAAAS
ncbi:MAG TPA: hypothetical protein VE911_01095 [Candidatus Nitrosopolaris sp.]|nr:hypothetical protein [Candidatus Nitrosopolaris sp.]